MTPNDSRDAWDDAMKRYGNLQGMVKEAWKRQGGELERIRKLSRPPAYSAEHVLNDIRAFRDAVDASIPILQKYQETDNQMWGGKKPAAKKPVAKKPAAKKPAAKKSVAKKPAAKK